MQYTHLNNETHMLVHIQIYIYIHTVYVYVYYMWDQDIIILYHIIYMLSFSIQQHKIDISTYFSPVTSISIINHVTILE